MKMIKSLGSESLATLAVITILACVLKFLMEGVTFDLAGHAVSLGHADSLTYAALLTPVLGAHSYIKSKGPKEVVNAQT